MKMGPVAAAPVSSDCSSAIKGPAGPAQLPRILICHR